MLDRDPLRVLDEVVARLPDSERTTISDGLSHLLEGVQGRLNSNGFGICESCSLFAAAGAPDERDGPHRCGLTGEPVGLSESQRICVNYQIAR